MRSILYALALIVVLILSFNKLVYTDIPVANYSRLLTEVNSYKREISSISIADSNFTDLNRLDTVLKDNRILMLGEMLHNDGETFKVKARLIRYLHEQMDYDVVLYEAGQYDMWMMDRHMDTTTNGAQFKTIGGIGLFEFWWRNQENQALLAYYQQTKSTSKPIVLGGFDIQFSGGKLADRRAKLLQDFLHKNGIDSTSYPLLNKHAEKLAYLTYERFANKLLDANAKKQILAELDALSRLIRRRGNDLEYRIYGRYFSDMKNNFDKSWRFPVGSMQSMHFRDSLMAKNLIYQIDSVHPGKKIIVWCANIHTFSAPYNKEYLPLGAYIKKKFGDQVYCLDFTSYGRYDEVDRIVNRASKLAVENVFHATMSPYFFLDLRSLPKNSFLGQHFNSALNQGIDENRKWRDFIDGIFYIDINKNPTYH